MSFYTQFKPTSGVQRLIAGTGTAVSTSTGIVTVWTTASVSTLQDVTNNGNVTTNPILINNSTASTGTNTGALIVNGGVGIGGDVYLGGVLHASEITSTGLFAVSPQLVVKSDPLDSASSATIVINSLVPVGYSAFTIQNTGLNGRSYTIDVGGNNRAFTGGTSVNEGNLTVYDDIDGAYRLVLTKTGNLLVGTETDTGAKLTVGGAISASTGTLTGPLIVQTSLIETTITQVNTADTTEIANFAASEYRSCKCFVQVEDTGNYHITEIVLLHDDIGQVYKSEYGIISTGGEKGSFSADLQLDGKVRLYFTADSVSDKTIKVIKTAIAA